MNAKSLRVAARRLSSLREAGTAKALIVVFSPASESGRLSFFSGNRPA